MADRTEELLNTILDSLRANEDVAAVWLAGSRGRGTADDFSDIDIWIALDDEVVPAVIDDPLAFVHRIVPTVMHILAPSIAPAGGSFANTWVPLEDEFVQVDWYFVPKSSATRDAETKLVFGDIAIDAMNDVKTPATDSSRDNAQKNLKDALQMIGNLVKHGQRGDFWKAADHARHVDQCMIRARSFLTTGSEPGFIATKESFLPGTPPTTSREVQELALTLLDTVAELAIQANANLDEAITAMRSTVRNWRATGWKPTEEYYRTLPRRYMGAGMLFTDAEGNVLLLETTYKKVYEIPGGVVESGESPRMTAHREAQEELGISIEPGRLLVFDSRNQPFPKGDAVMLVYDGGVIEDPAILQPDGEEIADVRFVRADELDQFCTPQMATRLRAALRARNPNRTIEITNGETID